MASNYKRGAPRHDGGETHNARILKVLCDSKGHWLSRKELCERAFVARPQRHITELEKSGVKILSKRTDPPSNAWLYCIEDAPASAPVAMERPSRMVSIGLQVSAQDRAKLRESAVAHGLSVSAWTRDILDGEVFRQVVHDLSELKNNADKNNELWKEYQNKYKKIGGSPCWITIQVTPKIQSEVRQAAGLISGIGLHTRNDSVISFLIRAVIRKALDLI